MLFGFIVSKFEGVYFSQNTTPPLNNCISFKSLFFSFFIRRIQDNAMIFSGEIKISFRLKVSKQMKKLSFPGQSPPPTRRD